MRQRDDLDFTMAEYERRLTAVRGLLSDRDLDGLIVTTPENILYLTGYQTTGYFYFQALVVPTADEPFMVTRLLEDSNVQARTWIERSRPFGDTESPVTALRYSLGEFGLSAARLGYEKNSYFFRANEQEQLFSSAPECTFVDASGLIESLRVVKSAEEIAVMRAAAEATDAGIVAGIEAVHAGATENDIAAEIHYAMIKAGSDYPAMSPFVATGPRGALGHTTWEGYPIEPGHAVFIEVGGCRRRYHTALMRTVQVGPPPPEVQDAAALVLEAMEAAMAAIHPGVAAGDVDAVARAVLGRFRHDGSQSTRSGYSIGLSFAPDWGEGHILSILPREPRPLLENMTFHLIPWLQIPGRFGMGISETIRVTEDGCERFSRLERRLHIR